jgi:hypothetical protein
LRRSILAMVVALTLLGSAPTATAAPPAPPAPADDPALVAVRSLLGEVPALLRRTENRTRPEVSLAMRDLFVALPRLDAADRREADRYLARPTDGDADRLGDGYTVRARKKCRNHICIHWVPTTADAPPNERWVDTNLAFANKVWRTVVRKLGYRKPISDNRRGGNGKLDVYLKELGSRGVYGYCAPERRLESHKWLASGYCVLDNDFAREQYGAPPRDTMRVTTAHEFFHAVQYAYDYGEDPWLLESTATWMEEQVADDVNDNRQYLPHGQVGKPGQPLDKFIQSGFNQYGNWAFFEYLSDRFGTGVVRTIWARAGAYPGGGHQYSTTAVKGVLARHGGFVKVFREFSAGNAAPGRTYREGHKWPAAPMRKSWVLTNAERSATGTTRINHMASAHVRIKPGKGVAARGWKLRLTVDGPAARTDPAAYLIVKRKHGVSTKAIRLDRDGEGRITVPFGSRKVRSATVTLVNASTRFSCWHRTSWSCQGRARDNRQPFELTASVVPPKR